MTSYLRLSSFGLISNPDCALQAGFKLGAKGTHTSRTLMLAELRGLFQATLPNTDRAGYTTAIVEENCLAKRTVATRRLTRQRLTELYALDPLVPVFRVLRKLWDQDANARPLLAMQCAIARDPLLAATAPPVLSRPVGSEFLREPVKAALLDAVGERLNDSILNKVIRNAASSWTQSGHLEGRTLKKRRQVHPTPANVAYSLFLGYTAGFRGTELFSCIWMILLDCSPSLARELAFEAKRLGLIDLRMAADVIELKLDRLSSGIQGL
jgi:hypothetical protein